MGRSREEVLEFKKELEERTASFAVAVFRFLDGLPNRVSSRVIAFQLGKSASSVGANYCEANRAESSNDFLHKMGISLKECSESLYWLNILKRLHPSSEVLEKLLKECEELIKIFQSARTTIYEKRKSHSVIR